MRNSTARIALLAGVVTLGCAALPAATARRLAFDALVSRSHLVVHARVVGTRPYWDAETKTIWTATELRVLDAAKGASGRSLIIKEPGGVLGSVGHVFPGVPQFAVDEEVVVFLHSGPGNRLRVTGLQQGVYAVTTEPGSGRSVVRPSGRGRAEAVFERGSRPAAQLFAPDECRLSDFLQQVRQRAR